MTKQQARTTEGTTAQSGKKDAQPVQTEMAASHQAENAAPGWSAGKIFWGLFLVIIGTLLLLDNFGVVRVDLLQLWRLWPLAIILGGLSILSVRGVWWKVIVVVASLLALGAVVAVALGYPPRSSGSVRESSASVERESAEVSRLRTSIKSGVGTLSVRSDDTEALVAAELESDVAQLRQVSRREDNLQSVDISTEFQGGWQFGDIKNDLQVAISDDVPLELTVDTGASKADINLETALLERLTIKAGASSVKVRLGSRTESTRFDLEAGASSVEIVVPDDVGVRVLLESGLASSQLEDLENKGNGLFESANYARADRKVEISAKIGAGSLQLRRD